MLKKFSMFILILTFVFTFGTLRTLQNTSFSNYLDGNGFDDNDDVVEIVL